MKRLIATIALSSTLLAGVTAAEPLSDHELALLRKIAADPDKQGEAFTILGGIRPAAHQAQRTIQTARLAPEPYRDELGTLVRKNEVAAVPADRAAPATPQPFAKPKQYSECAGFTFLLRKDWKDIGFAGCPQAASKAIGAEVAFSDDRAGRNRIWAVNGTAALLYNSIADQPAWWNPDYLSFGAYTTVNRTLNSSATASAANADKLAYGMAATLGYLDKDYGGHFLSLRGGGVENHIKNTSAASFTLEYQPVVNFLYFAKPIQRPFGLPYFLRFDPSLLVQYSEVTGTKQILDFNNRTAALRVGPQIATYFNAYPGGTTFLSRMNASLTYHWAYEAYSRKNLTWLSTAVGFNLDDAGHLAVAFTYNRGNDEDTGTFTNIYRIGLTGKI